MRIIDLLNKIANGEELPKIIKYKDSIYEYKTNIFGTGYLKKDCKNIWFCNEVFVDDIAFLNDEVEIIEEYKKIEKLNKILRIDDLEPPYDSNLHKIWKNVIIQQNKINEIIDKLNEMENKNDNINNY